MARGFLDATANGVLNEFHNTRGSQHNAQPNVIGTSNNTLSSTNIEILIKIPTPVYIDTSPAVAYHCVANRARKEESTVTLDYLQELDRHHAEWLADIHARNQAHESDIEVRFPFQDNTQHLLQNNFTSLIRS